MWAIRTMPSRRCTKCYGVGLFAGNQLRWGIPASEKVSPGGEFVRHGVTHSAQIIVRFISCPTFLRPTSMVRTTGSSPSHGSLWTASISVFLIGGAKKFGALLTPS